MGLDEFLTTAARLARRRGGGELTAFIRQRDTLLREAPSVLQKHPERAAEIAFGVQRVGPYNAAQVAHFAAEFARIARGRLPGPGERLTRTQAHEALGAYLALHGLGEGATSAMAPLEAYAAEGAAVLNAPVLASALARLGSGPKGSTLVSRALQASFVTNPASLAALSLPDFVAVAGGVARAVEVLPDAAAAVLAAASSRFEEMPQDILLDLTWVVAELRSRVLEHHGAADAFLKEAWLRIAGHLTEAVKVNAEGTHMHFIASLRRIAAALPSDSLALQSFGSVVLRPGLPVLTQSVADDMDSLELVAPLVRIAGDDGSGWAALLQRTSLQGFSNLPLTVAGTERLLLVTEAVAEIEKGAPAFPPFFDFAFEELLQRLNVLPPSELRRVARLFASVHLERPDLLSGAATSLSAAAALITSCDTSVEETKHLPDLALSLAAFSSLYGRVVEVRPDANSDGIATSDGALEAIARVLEGLGDAFIQQAIRLPATDSHGTDAACLALSAFAGVLCRAPETIPDTVRGRLLSKGVALFEVLCSSWTRAGISLTAPQVHIFLVALRALCAGPGVAAPPGAVTTMLRTVLAHASAKAPAGDRDAQLSCPCCWNSRAIHPALECSAKF
jgi:hypothetical protein